GGRCLPDGGPGVDEVTVLRTWRDGGRAGGRRARGDGDGQKDERPSQINSIAAAKVFGSPASSQCTFRSPRSHVICRLAYARVRRRVSSIAASSAISPASIAAASR